MKKLLFLSTTMSLLCLTACGETSETTVSTGDEKKAPAVSSTQGSSSKTSWDYDTDSFLDEKNYVGEIYNDGDLIVSLTGFEVDTDTHQLSVVLEVDNNKENAFNFYTAGDCFFDGVGVRFGDYGDSLEVPSGSEGYILRFPIDMDFMEINEITECGEYEFWWKAVDAVTNWQDGTQGVVGTAPPIEMPDFEYEVEVAESPFGAVEPVIICDKGGVFAEFIGFSVDYLDYLCLDFRITSNAEKNLSLLVSEVMINDIIIDTSDSRVISNDGKESIVNIALDSRIVEAMDMDYFNNGSLKVTFLDVSVYGSESVNSDTVYFETEHMGVIEMQDVDKTNKIFDDGEIKVYSLGYSSYSGWGSHALALYLENTTDENDTFSVQNVCFDGVSYDSAGHIDVPAGGKGVFMLYSSDYMETGLFPESFDSLTFDLSRAIYDDTLTSFIKGYDKFGECVIKS